MMNHVVHVVEIQNFFKKKIFSSLLATLNFDEASFLYDTIAIADATLCLIRSFYKKYQRTCTCT